MALFPPGFLVSPSDCCLGQSGKCTWAMNSDMHEMKEQRYRQSREGQNSRRAETKGERTTNKCEESSLVDSVSLLS